MKGLKRYQQRAPGDGFRLGRIDPGETPFSSGDDERDKRDLVALEIALDDCQNLFYAARRKRMLVVLQGVDCSGKDGTLRHVFGRMSPLGVRTVAWKAPNEEERAHDFLWRIGRELPRDGEVVVFNRSHYEDVLVPVVQGTIDKREVRRRYGQIVDFERRLVETGTVVCKFMLHISRNEQRERLQARLDDPTKRWKFDPADLEARRSWDDYQAAYEAAIRTTGTPWAPWTVVPADSKTHRNLMIGRLLKRAFDDLDLRFPPLPAELVGLEVA